MAYQKPGGGGVASDEVNATLANVLAGKTALTSDSNDEVGTGTMQNRGAVSGSVGVGGTYTIQDGYHNGSGTVAGPTLSGNASAGQVLSNATFYSNSGAKQTGTMPNNGATGTTLGFGGSYSIPSGYTSGGTVNVSITDRRGWASGVGVGGTTYIPEGYHNGNGYVYGPSDGNLTAGNIRSGVSIFGVWGNISAFASESLTLSRTGANNYGSLGYCSELYRVPSFNFAGAVTRVTANQSGTVIFHMSPAGSIGRSSDGNSGYVEHTNYYFPVCTTGVSSDPSIIWNCWGYY